jgi:hypothetical protein
MMAEIMVKTCSLYIYIYIYMNLTSCEEFNYVLFLQVWYSTEGWIQENATLYNLAPCFSAQNTYSRH